MTYRVHNLLTQVTLEIKVTPSTKPLHDSIRDILFLFGALGDAYFPIFPNVWNCSLLFVQKSSHCKGIYDSTFLLSFLDWPSLFSIPQDRAWDLTIASRGKSKDFWGPYVEEWQIPPTIKGDGEGVGWLEQWIGKWWTRMLLNRFVLFPLQLYPFVGLGISAWMRAYGTSRYLHTKVREIIVPLVGT